MEFKRFVVKGFVYDGSEAAKEAALALGASFGPDGVLFLNGETLCVGQLVTVEMEPGLFEEVERELIALNGNFATDREDAITKSKRDLFWRVDLNGLLERLRE